MDFLNQVYAIHAGQGNIHQNQINLTQSARLQTRRFPPPRDLESGLWVQQDFLLPAY